MSGWTYEIRDAGTLTQWGTFTVEDITYQGDDLAQVAAEIVGTYLAAGPNPLVGQILLWAQLTGLPPTGPPDYTGDLDVLLGAS